MFSIAGGELIKQSTIRSIVFFWFLFIYIKIYLMYMVVHMDVITLLLLQLYYYVSLSLSLDPSMTHLWPIYGASMTLVWPMHDPSMTLAWPIHDPSMGLKMDRWTANIPIETDKKWTPVLCECVIYNRGRGGLQGTGWGTPMRMWPAHTHHAHAMHTPHVRMCRYTMR